MSDNKKKVFDIKVGEKTYSFKELTAREYVETLPAGLKEVIKGTVRRMADASLTNISFNKFMNLSEKEFMCLYQQYVKANAPMEIDNSFLEKE